MKKMIFAFLLTGLLAACNNEGGTTADPVDSLEERKDTLLENVDSTADAKIDSIQDRAEDLKQKFDSTYDQKIDSLKENNQ